MLVNCNTLSQIHLQKANQEFKRHIQLLNEVKKDLDNIFKRVKALKAKAASQYPEAYKGLSIVELLPLYILASLKIIISEAVSQIQEPVIEDEEEAWYLVSQKLSGAEYVLFIT